MSIRAATVRTSIPPCQRRQYQQFLKSCGYDQVQAFTDRRCRALYLLFMDSVQHGRYLSDHSESRFWTCRRDS